MSWAVIGGGPSGLAVARAFMRDGVPFVGYERHVDVGGIWDIDNDGSPMYESAHFISSKTMSALDGLPFPQEYPDYPSHPQLLAYLRTYAEEFGLRQQFRFGTPVDAAEPVGERWRLTLAGGEQVEHDGVVLATGTQWAPRMPQYPGTWDGESFHSQSYRDADVFRGKRVLVVGGGNSGCDIACDAAVLAERASLSLRRGYRFVPKHMFGMPTDVFANRGPHLPGWLEQRVFDRLLDLTVGDLRRYGLARPDHHVLATHPILNTQVLHHLAHGDLEARPDVAELLGDRVRFVDGTVEPYDLLVWATGYRVGFPVLPEGVVTFTRENEPGLFLNVFPPGRIDVAVCGMLETDGGAWPLISLQADLISDVARLDRQGREAAAFKALTHQPRKLEGGVRHIDSPRHRYYTQWHEYTKTVRKVTVGVRSGELPLTRA
jgi:cation diffusion facilitator CzcD-associated flavoprotein CzcO